MSKRYNINNCLDMDSSIEKNQSSFTLQQAREQIHNINLKKSMRDSGLTKSMEIERAENKIPLYYNRQEVDNLMVKYSGNPNQHFKDKSQCSRNKLKASKEVDKNDHVANYKKLKQREIKKIIDGGGNSHMVSEEKRFNRHKSQSDLINYDIENIKRIKLMETERLTQTRSGIKDPKIKNQEKLEFKMNALNENLNKIQDGLVKKDIDPSNKFSLKSLIKTSSKKRVQSQPSIKDYECSDKRILKSKLNSSGVKQPMNSMRSKTSAVFIEDYIREQDNSQKAVKQMEDKLVELGHCLNDANRKIFEKDIMIDKLKGSFNDEFRNKIPQLNEILNEANSKLFEKDMLLEKFSNEINQLKEQNQTYLEEKEKFKNNVDQKDEIQSTKDIEVEKYKTEINAHFQRMDDLTNQVSMKDNEIIKLSDQLDSIQESEKNWVINFETLKNDLEDAKQVNTLKSQDTNKLTSKITALETKCNILVSEYDQNKEMVSQLKKVEEESQTRNLELEINLISKDDELTKMIVKLGRLQSENTNLLESQAIKLQSIDLLKNTNEDLKTLNEELKSQSDLLNKLNSKHRQEIGQKDEEQVTIQESYNKLFNFNLTLSTNIEFLENENNVLKRNFNEIIDHYRQGSEVSEYEDSGENEKKPNQKEQVEIQKLNNLKNLSNDLKLKLKEINKLDSKRTGPLTGESAPRIQNERDNEFINIINNERKENTLDFKQEMNILMEKNQQLRTELSQKNGDLDKEKAAQVLANAKIASQTDMIKKLETQTSARPYNIFSTTYQPSPNKSSKRENEEYNSGLNISELQGTIEFLSTENDGLQLNQKQLEERYTDSVVEINKIKTDRYNSELVLRELQSKNDELYDKLKRQEDVNDILELEHGDFMRKVDKDNINAKMYDKQLTSIKASYDELEIVYEKLKGEYAIKTREMKQFIDNNKQDIITIKRLESELKEKQTTQQIGQENEISVKTNIIKDKDRLISELRNRINQRSKLIESPPNNRLGTNNPKLNEILDKMVSSKVASIESKMVSENNQKINDQQAQIEQKDSQIKVLENERLNIESKLSYWKNQEINTNMSNKIDELEQKILTQQTIIVDLENIVWFKNCESPSKAMNETDLNENSTTSQNVNVYSPEKKMAEEQTHSSESTKTDDIKKMLYNLTRSKLNLMKTVEKLRKEIDILRKDNHDKNKVISELTFDINYADLDTKLLKKTTENEKSKYEIERKCNDMLRMQIDSLVLELDNKTSLLVENYPENSKNSSPNRVTNSQSFTSIKYQNLESEVDHLKEKVELLTKENLINNELLESKSKDCEKMSKAIKYYIETENKFIENITKKKSKIQGLKDSLNQEISLKEEQEANILNLNAKINEQNSAQQDLKGSEKVKDTRIASEEKYYGRLSRQNNELSDEIKSLKISFSKEQDNKKHYDKNVIDLNYEIKVLIADKQHFMNEIIHLKSKMEDKNNEIKNLSEDLSNQLQNGEENADRVKHQESIKEELRFKIQEYDCKVKDFNKKSVRSESFNNDDSVNFKKSHEMIYTSMSKDISFDEMDLLKKENKRIKDHSIEILEIADALKKELELKHNANEKLFEEIDQLKEENNDLVLKTEQLETEVSSCKLFIAKNEETYQVLKKNVDDFEKNVTHLEFLNNNLKNDNCQLETYKGSTSKTIEILTKRLNDANSTIENLSNELEKVQKELLESTESQINENTNIQSYQTENSKLIIEKERLVSMSLNDEKIAMIYEKQIKSLEEENIALNEYNKKMKIQFRDYENTLNQKPDSRRGSLFKKHLENTFELEKFEELEVLQNQVKEFEEKLLKHEEEMKLKELKVNTIESINADQMERVEDYQEQIENYAQVIKELEKEIKKLSLINSDLTNSKHSMYKEKPKKSMQINEVLYIEGSNGEIETPRKKFASPNPSPMPKIQDTINLKSQDGFMLPNQGGFGLNEKLLTFEEPEKKTYKEYKSSSQSRISKISLVSQKSDNIVQKSLEFGSEIIQKPNVMEYNDVDIDFYENVEFIRRDSRKEIGFDIPIKNDSRTFEAAKKTDKDDSTFIVEQKLMTHEKEITDLESHLEEKNKLIESLLSQMNDSESNYIEPSNFQSTGTEKTDTILQQQSSNPIENRSKSPKGQNKSTNLNCRSPNTFTKSQEKIRSSYAASKYGEKFMKKPASTISNLKSGISNLKEKPVKNSNKKNA